jgi:hypothetical protein
MIYTIGQLSADYDYGITCFMKRDTGYLNKMTKKLYRNNELFVCLEGEGLYVDIGLPEPPWEYPKDNNRMSKVVVYFMPNSVIWRYEDPPMTNK